VDPSALWKALRSTGVPPFLVHLIQDLHLGSKSRVRTNNRLSDPFTTTSGVRQGCVLAHALVCIAIDWITSRCVGTMGVSVGNTTFTDQDYTDDAVLFTDDPSKCTEILTNLDAASQTMGLHTSRSKTHLQNTGHGTAPQAVTIQGGHTVDVVERFTDLGSDISSCSRSKPEMFRRIGLASSVMSQRQSRLSLCTKLRLYNSAVVSVLLYGSETWTLTKSDEQKLEVFRMSCICRILGLRWFDFVPNMSMMNQTQQRSICSRIRDRRVSIFGHVRRLPESAPAHEALRLVVNTRAGHRPDDRPEWKRLRGRPRQTWNDPPAGGRRRAHRGCRLGHGQ